MRYKRSAVTPVQKRPILYARSAVPDDATTEKQPLMDHAHGRELSARFRSIDMASGKGIPIAMPRGATKKSGTIGFKDSGENEEFA